MHHKLSLPQKWGLLGILIGVTLLTLTWTICWFMPRLCNPPSQITHMVNYPASSLWHTLLQPAERILGVRELGFHAYSYPAGVPNLLRALQILLHCAYWFLCGFLVGKI